jgi:hypothetical protein
MMTVLSPQAEMVPYSGEIESGYAQREGFGYNPDTVYELHIPADLPPFGTVADHTSEHYTPTR